MNGTFNGTTYNFSVTYNANGGDGTANDVVLTTTAVPEPASAGLLGLAAGGLLVRRRRQNHRSSGRR